ncbi:hypothetical protein [Bifidobacterium vespertilionis]|uniref:DUF5648 domain-containing protein n=1 Tax=Bifidobacterium vespertilionis TaxID=2562524 RepID=A0A5J5DTX2_9BIFI|nr:hypothetical protein [Bifidobacterium vespertilionis]KAA8819006.1 hypothetical protein EMO90_08600 [Bifidobacterium vespertilionis]KAA8821448.1 hypothetical protein EM848_10845 [Bifidobacterium vespertilionis]
MKRLGRAIVAFAAVVGMMIGGVGVAQAADPTDGDGAPDGSGQPTLSDIPYSVSDVSVKDIGAHTANVTYNWKIDVPADQIKSVCFIVNVRTVTDITPLNYDGDYSAAGLADWPNCASGTGDSELTQTEYQSIYGSKSHDLSLVDKDGSAYLAAEYTGQNFFRWMRDSWDGTSSSGTISVPVIGLAPETTYKNTFESSVSTGLEWQLSAKLEQLWKDGVKEKTPLDLGEIYAGLRAELTDGSVIVFDRGSAPVPDFTTNAEPAGKAEADLPEDARDNITVDGAGTVTAGKTARIYINDLKESCAGSKSCFWYGYIYSEPTKLTSPDGAPFLTVQKDDAGKAYVDALIPADLTGDHTIALADETGEVQGWTTVSVEEPAPAAKRMAVYRLYNQYMTSGTNHLFTTDKEEYDGLVELGWTGEDIQFYAAASDADGAKPVYRLYNQWDGSHHFTVDAAEKDNLVKIGWTLEPTTWWAPADGDAKVYRLYNQWSGEHLFTTDKGESDKLAGLGWTVEESGFSVYSQGE